MLLLSRKTKSMNFFSQLDFENSTLISQECFVFSYGVSVTFHRVDFPKYKKSIPRLLITKCNAVIFKKNLI